MWKQIQRLTRLFCALGALFFLGCAMEQPQKNELKQQSNPLMTWASRWSPNFNDANGWIQMEDPLRLSPNISGAYQPRMKRFGPCLCMVKTATGHGMPNRQKQAMLNGRIRSYLSGIFIPGSFIIGLGQKWIKIMLISWFMTGKCGQEQKNWR